MRLQSIAIALAVFTAALIVVVHHAESINPGMKLTMQSAILDEAAGKIATKLNNKILNTNIPNQSGSFGIPVIGKVVWSVTNIKIKTLTISDTSLVTVPNTGLKLYTQNININLDLSWEVKLKSIIFGFDEKGTASAKTSDAAATFVVQFGALNNRLTASLSENSFVMQNLRIHITAQGVPNWILEIITGLIDRPVKRSIESAIQKNVANLVVQLNSNLQAINPLIPLGMLDFNAGIPMAPTFTSTYLSVPLIADFVIAANPTVESPAVAAPMPDYATTDTLNVMINEYFYDTLGWALFTGNLIDLKTASNTTAWKDAIPGLYSAYPDTALTLETTLSNVPTVNISANSGVSMNSNFNIDYYVNLQNGSSPLVLQLEVSTAVTVLLSLNVTNNGTVDLVGKLNNLALSVSVIASSVGRVNVGIINTTLKTIIATVIKPAINKALGGGIPLPFIPNGSVVSNLNVLYFDGYQALTATITLPTSSVVKLLESNNSAANIRRISVQ